MTRIQTDLFKSGVPVVYFTYEGSENSIYCDEDGMSCSIGCKEGSWIGFNTIDIANVPNFNGDESSMAHYMPDVFPYHDSDADCVSQAMVNGELNFFVVMYKEYYGKIFAKSVEYSDYAEKYGNGDLDECFKNGYIFYTNFGLDESKVGDFSDWANVFTEIKVTKEYEVQNVIWYLDDGDGHFTTYSKMVGDDVIIDYICEDVDSRGYQRFPGVVYGAYYMNVEMGELHKEDYKKGLGLVEYDDCIVYYSK